MSFKITVEPSGHAFEAAPGQTLLQSALDQGVLLPYGCRNGACGACKGTLMQGQVDLGSYQEHALSAEERAAGKLLFCCAQALTDLTIQCKEVKSTGEITARTLPARVQKMALLAPDVMEIHLKLPASERLQFVAGQYIEILLKDGRRRAFSLANAPQDDEVLQLHVRRVPGGVFTEHVFTGMKEKDILRLNGPHGSFRLEEDCDRPVIFVAGGTGFAPAKAIIEYAIHSQIERPMVIYWGSRDRAGLYQDALARAWAERHPHIHYVPVLSEPASRDAWSGRTGLVHEAVLADFPNLAGYQVYACGAPAMIEAARRDFLARGLPEDEFLSDAFTFSV
ncbi:MAG: CDP-6-deoxy-delta-3,4-glucoseen reductase [Rhodocyclaceae bacterium]|nr:CDP-6-deoxy-delta-3,4-glucoseen reductase [Rhodocyclaceae bacterium]